MTNGLIARSLWLLSISKRPSLKTPSAYLIERYAHYLVVTGINRPRGGNRLIPPESSGDARCHALDDSHEDDPASLVDVDLQDKRT